MKYVSFWIPTLIKKETFSPRKKKIERVNISDPLFRNHHVDLCMEENSLSFNITFDNNEVVSFLFIGQDSSGFLIYEIKGALLNEWHLSSIKQPIYHLFKELFHDHEFHDDEQDSLLFAYIFDADVVNISRFVEDSFKHYISIYYHKCIAYQNSIRKDIDAIKEKQNIAAYSFTGFKKLYRTRERILKFFGEFVYFKALSSKQTNHHRYDECFLIKDYIKIRLSLIEATTGYISFRLNLFLAFVGLFVSLIGTIIAVHSIIPTTEPKATLQTISKFVTIYQSDVSKPDISRLSRGAANLVPKP